MNIIFFIAGIKAYTAPAYMGELFFGFFSIYQFFSRVTALHFSFGEKIYHKLAQMSVALFAIGIISELANNSISFLPFSKLFGSLLLFYLTSIGIYLFINTAFKKLTTSRIVLCFISLQMGLIASSFFFPSEYAVTLQNNFKWGYGAPLAAISLAVAYLLFFSRPHLVIPLFIILILPITSLSLLNESRGIPLFIIIAFLPALANKSVLAQSFLTILSIIVLFVWGQDVDISAFNFILSKTLEQSTGFSDVPLLNIFSPVIGSRPELIASAHAFWDKPLLGHGALAPDLNGKYALILKETLYLYGYATFKLVRTDVGIIPTHSVIGHFVVAWGILAILPWLYLLYSLWYSFIKYYSFLTNKVASILPFYLLLNITWAVAFSPFGFENRFFLAAYVAFLLIFLSVRAYPIPKDLPSLAGSS